MKHTSAENIAEALDLLEEAAEQKKDELKAVISDKYTNLRSLIVANETSLVKSLISARDHALRAVTSAEKAGVAKACELTRDVDVNVHANPWPYIAGSAVVGILLGMILDRNAK